MGGHRLVLFRNSVAEGTQGKAKGSVKNPRSGSSSEKSQTITGQRLKGGFGSVNRPKESKQTSGEGRESYRSRDPQRFSVKKTRRAKFYDWEKNQVWTPMSFQKRRKKTLVG